MKDDKKSIFGWCMYDWANSAYITTVGVALLPIYFADGIVGKAGVIYIRAESHCHSVMGLYVGRGSVAGLSFRACAWRNR